MHLVWLCKNRWLSSPQFGWGFCQCLAHDVCVFVWVCDWWGSGLCCGKRVCVNRSMCVKAGQRVGSGLREQMLPDWPHAQAEHSSGDQETHQIVNCHNEDQQSQHYANNSPCYHTSLDWNWEKKREYKVRSVEVCRFKELLYSFTDLLVALCLWLNAPVLCGVGFYRHDYITEK